MSRLVLTFTFLICFQVAKAHDVHPDQIGFISSLEKKLESKFFDYADSIAKWLESINDRHLNGTELGKLLGYNLIKPKLNNVGSEARGMGKISMALLPIIFYVGATSSWMVITALLAAKSVAIGLTLLVFKIAVSVAKLTSFFTVWKLKHHQHSVWPAPVYSDHHHHAVPNAHHPHADFHPHYTPDWSSLPEYKTLPELEYSESKKVTKKDDY